VGAFMKNYFIYVIFLWIAGLLILCGISIDKELKVINDRVIVLKGSDLKVTIKNAGNVSKTTVTAP
jgi:hypothetical protein